MPAGRSGLQWGAGGLQKREESDTHLLSCSAARSQIPGGLVALASYLFSAPFPLHRASGSPLWILSRVFKSPGRWKLAWRHQIAERDVLWLLLVCLSEIPWESHPFQVEEMSPLVSKGGKSSLRERLVNQNHICREIILGFCSTLL